MSTTILVCAGGTGGHLFPAHALADELIARGFDIELATDERAERYGTHFPARAIHVVSSATFGGRNALAIARGGARLARGLMQSWGLVGRCQPLAAVGFGGYPTVPPILAAALRGVPTIVHEQNAVVGRANRFLARRVDMMAISFPEVRHLDIAAERIVETGNPVREAVVAVRQTPYEPPLAEGPLRLVVFGGSQGARIFSDVVPAAIGRLAPEMARRISVVQQCRPEDLARVREAYDRLGVSADLGSFFADLPERIADAHLVIARSGASTVSELTVMGRPAMLVPYPHALDGDQEANAAALVARGGAVLIRQDAFTPSRLAEELMGFIRRPERLAAIAAAARRLGRPDAVAALASLVQRVIEDRYRRAK